MDDKHAKLRRAFEGRVLLGPGEAPTALRQAAAGHGDLPADLAAFVDKVARQAYRITDEDVAALRAAGHAEDVLLELTWAAAVGAARDRMDAAARALAKGGDR